MQIIRDNVRLPESTIGDMHSGVAAARVGAARIRELAAKYKVESVLEAMEDLLDYGERMTIEEIRKLPAGSYQATDIVEGDGLGNGPFEIQCTVTIGNGKITADFTGTSKQAQGPINCAYTGLITGARCLFKAVTNTEIPANGGCFRPLEVICPEGTVISATSPAPVSLYYESLIAAIDVMWKALAPALSDRLSAGHQRTVGANFISGKHPDTGELFVMGQPLVGGWGASDGVDGDSGQFCCGNGETYNVPVELFETRYGLQVEQYAFHDEAGGEGQYRGGKGVVLDYRVISPEVFLTYAASRTEARPWSIDEGLEGSTNYAKVLRKSGKRSAIPCARWCARSKATAFGWCRRRAGATAIPGKRKRAEIERDIKNGYLSPERAPKFSGSADEALLSSANFPTVGTESGGGWIFPSLRSPPRPPIRAGISRW